LWFVISLKSFEHTCGFSFGFGAFRKSCPSGDTPGFVVLTFQKRKKHIGNVFVLPTYIRKFNKYGNVLVGKKVNIYHHSCVLIKQIT
jgi:hypothetical protein